MKMKEFAAKIRAKRISNRFTREQVCALLAMPLDEYIAIEEGSKSASAQFITDVVNLYGVDRGWLMGNDKNPLKDDF
jgi:transcriptional regulator with XRE-family HTH domain